MGNRNLINTFIDMKKKNRIKYSNWNEHLRNTKELTNYSTRRTDLLIISICGAGIYILFETLREFKTGEITIESPNLLIWSGVSFLIAITSNFISQRTGYYANKNEEAYTMLELDKIQGEKFDQCEQDIFDKKVNNYNSATNILNTVSIVLMFIGLILLAIFNYSLF